jgi:AmmeMemoRadiSam system protein A
MFRLPEPDRRFLLNLARNAVQAHLSAIPLQLSAVHDGITCEPHGVFVSIHQGRQLRGCIGNVMPELPLYQTTARCAIAAATSDPRFPAVTLGELPLLSFEISVLSPPELVNTFEEIEVGKHGLIVSKGSARGLLLPQVPVEYGWNRNQFLSETCIKAGLDPNAWHEGTVIHSFTADVFGEDQIHQLDRPAAS